jgi:hypothetical protein
MDQRHPKPNLEHRLLLSDGQLSARLFDDRSGLNAATLSRILGICIQTVFVNYYESVVPGMRQIVVKMEMASNWPHSGYDSPPSGIQRQYSV